MVTGLVRSCRTEGHGWNEYSRVGYVVVRRAKPRDAAQLVFCASHIVENAFHCFLHMYILHSAMT